jgi:hypothetical protein
MPESEFARNTLIDIEAELGKIRELLTDVKDILQARTNLVISRQPEKNLFDPQRLTMGPKRKRA